MSMTDSIALWRKVAGPTKKVTVISGDVGVDPDNSQTPWKAAVSFGSARPTAFVPFVDQAPSNGTTVPRPGLYGSVAAAQDVCAADLACLGVRSHQTGPTTLLYPGISKPKVISDLVAAAGTTTWVTKRR